MQEIIELNQKSLSSLPKAVSRPSYDRSKVKAGILHVGIGGFHRAHQAFYTDTLLENDQAAGWGICGVALLERDQRIYDTLHQQDGLYTLMVRQPDGSLSASVIGAIVEYYFAPENPQRVIEKMASDAIKIITLTITEGGYNFDAATGEFKMNEPDIQWDLTHEDTPKTVFGYLTQALKRRKARNLPLTIQSCDNIQQNGDIAKKMLLDYVAEADPDLIPWIRDQVTFPNSMVDRITPITTPEDIAVLEQTYGIRDKWPVVSEFFYQWVIEDDFIAGRPAWNEAGAQFVPDVHPYEKMKIGIVNGGHSLIGLTGYLAGYGSIDETVHDPLFAEFLKQYMDLEVIPVLDEIAGVDLQEYRSTVIRRFGNPFIKDTVGRIIQESSAKIPKFILPTISENIRNGGPIRRSVTVVACWYRYLELAVIEDRFGGVEDAMKEPLLEQVERSLQSSPLHFLQFESIFGSLCGVERFQNTFLQIIQRIRRDGIRQTIQGELADDQL